MRFANAVLIGVASLAIAGSAAIAEGTQPRTHEMTVRLPDGGIARVEYTGNVAPKVEVSQGPALTFRTGFAPFWSDPAFGELNRVSAEMNQFWASFGRQMAGVMSANENVIRSFDNPNQPIDAAFGKMPAGSYSTVTEFSSNGACSRMVRITSEPGSKPKTTSQMSGDCGKARTRTGVDSGPGQPGNNATAISFRPMGRAARSDSL